MLCTALSLVWSDDVCSCMMNMRVQGRIHETLSQPIYVGPPLLRDGSVTLYSKHSISSFLDRLAFSADLPASLNPGALISSVVGVVPTAYQATDERPAAPLAGFSLGQAAGALKDKFNKFSFAKVANTPAYDPAASAADLAASVTSTAAVATTTTNSSATDKSPLAGIKSTLKGGALSGGLSKLKAKAAAAAAAKETLADHEALPTSPLGSLSPMSSPRGGMTLASFAQLPLSPRRTVADKTLPTPASVAAPALQTTGPLLDHTVPVALVSPKVTANVMLLQQGQAIRACLQAHSQTLSYLSDLAATLVSLQEVQDTAVLVNSLYRHTPALMVAKSTDAAGITAHVEQLLDTTHYHGQTNFHQRLATQAPVSSAHGHAHPPTINDWAWSYPLSVASPPSSAVATVASTTSTTPTQTTPNYTNTAAAQTGAGASETYKLPPATLLSPLPAVLKKKVLGLNTGPGSGTKPQLLKHSVPARLKTPQLKKPPSSPGGAAGVMALPEHTVLLKKAFEVYAAKNKHQASEGAHEKGFEQQKLGLTHMDAGETLVFLKGFRIVPRWLSVDVVKNLWVVAAKERARVGGAAEDDSIVHAIGPKAAEFVAKEKDSGLLNYREFCEFLVRIAIIIKYSDLPPESDEKKVHAYVRAGWTKIFFQMDLQRMVMIVLVVVEFDICHSICGLSCGGGGGGGGGLSFMRLLHAAVAEPKHDTTLKQIKEAVPPLPPTSISFQAGIKVTRHNDGRVWV
jgi:hypothetical protein